MSIYQKVTRVTINKALLLSVLKKTCCAARSAEVAHDFVMSPLSHSPDSIILNIKYALSCTELLNTLVRNFGKPLV